MALQAGWARLWRIEFSRILVPANAVVMHGQFAFRAVAARVAARTRWEPHGEEAAGNVMAFGIGVGWKAVLDGSRIVERLAAWAIVAARKVWRSDLVVSGRRGRRQPYQRLVPFVSELGQRGEAKYKEAGDNQQ
jgi:hypothetical protein